ncbi:MAG: hypothetical protein ABI999_18405 [Acidobacteriota bacterium]
MLKLTTTIALLFLTVAGSFAQINPAKLKINELIGLTSTYARVVKAFGRPVHDGKPKFAACIGGKEKATDYAGLGLYFADTRDGKTFELASFSVTSAKWAVSGLRIGDSQAIVKAKFGTKYTVDRVAGSGSISWGYDDADVATTVVFKKGKVVEINSGYMMC